MAEDFDLDSLRRRYDDRVRRLEALRLSINSTLDYFTRVPENESEEREQKEGIRRGLYRLGDQIRSFAEGLE